MTEFRYRRAFKNDSDCREICQIRVAILLGYLFRLRTQLGPFLFIATKILRDDYVENVFTDTGQHARGFAA